MPRSVQEKSTSRLLSDAHVAAGRAAASLQGVDLRTQRGPMRDNIREARSSAEKLVATLGTALQQDLAPGS
jgi:hypothetical protein